MWRCSYGVVNCRICRRTDINQEEKRRLCYERYQTRVAPDNRMYLNVPFAQKDQAKKLGGMWDSTQRKWYIDLTKADVAKFVQWGAKVLQQQAEELQAAVEGHTYEELMAALGAADAAAVAPIEAPKPLVEMVLVSAIAATRGV